MAVPVTCCSLEPNFLHSSAIKSELLGVDINVGEYFLCELAVHNGKAFSCHSSLSVCQILSTQPREYSLTVNIFEHSSRYYFQHKINTIKNETARHVEEVYQSPQIATIHVDNHVISAFVLSQEILLDPSQTPTLSGMTNLFLLQKTIDNAPIPDGECLAFPSS
jgi:hypothetical protein